MMMMMRPSRSFDPNAAAADAVIDGDGNNSTTTDDRRPRRRFPSNRRRRGGGGGAGNNGRFSFSILLVFFFLFFFFSTILLRDASSFPSVRPTPLRRPTTSTTTVFLGGVDDESTEERSSALTTAVVVGGGPGGLAAALVLSTVRTPKTTTKSTDDDDENGSFLFDRIVVVDQQRGSSSSSDDDDEEGGSSSSSYDPTRAYFYNVNRRGLVLLEAVGIDLSREGRGTPQNGFARRDVPSDPRIEYDGTEPAVRREVPEMGTTHWIPRSDLVDLLAEEAERRKRRIRVRRGLRCSRISPSSSSSTGGGGRRIDVAVIKSDGDDDEEIEEILTADLVVGADGAGSRVRRSLEEGRFDDPSRWINSDPKGFRLRKRRSPSTGLVIKGLRVRGDFAIPRGGPSSEEDGGGGDDDDRASSSTIPIDPQYTYSLESATTGTTDRIPLRILPQRPVARDGDDDGDDGFTRLVSICAEPGHDLWNPEIVRTDDSGRSAEAFFRRAHPRYDWGSIVRPEDWDLFARTEGSRFPPCQRSPRTHVAGRRIVDDDDDAKNDAAAPSPSRWGTGVVLLGDALRAFPPDLGQGVNAALHDAFVLGRSFKEAAIAATTSTSTTVTGGGEKKKRKKSESSSSSFVSDALERYERSNGPESKALVRLVRIGAPFQYDQSSLVNRFRKVLWTANLLLRTVLNKITMGVSPPPAILMSLNPNLSFRTIMRRADGLTAVLWTTAAVIAAALLSRGGGGGGGCWSWIRRAVVASS